MAKAKLTTRAISSTTVTSDNLAKGSQLTHNQLDSNFINLRDQTFGIAADDSATIQVGAGDTIYIQGGNNVTTSTDSAGVVTINATGEVTASSTTTFTNKTFDANGTGNSITNLEVADLASGVLDTDISSVSGSDNTLASAKAIKTYVDSQVSGVTAGQGFKVVGDDSASVDIAEGGTVYIQGGTNVTTATDSAGVVTINAADNSLSLIDEDDMSSNSATRPPSQQSVKAYVDAQDANIASDTLTLTNKTFDAEGTGNSLSNVDVANLKSGVLDTDISSVSGSDDTLASAKAIKTYVDSQVGGVAAGQGFKVIGDDSAGVDIPEAGTLYIQGGTGITTATDSAGVLTINGAGTATSLTTDGLEIIDNNISGTRSNEDIVIHPNGTGDVVLDTAEIDVGTGGENVTIKSVGDNNLILGAGSATINIENDGALKITPSGNDATSGGVTTWLNSSFTVVGTGSGSARLHSNGSQTLALGTNNGNQNVLRLQTSGAVFDKQVTMGNNALGDVGSLDVNGDATIQGSIIANNIKSNSNGDISIQPGGTGNLLLGAVKINGTTLSSDDSTKITVAEAVDVTGALVAGTSLNIAGSGATVTGILDEDNMASNSNVKLATQQSIKAYVDAEVAGAGGGGFKVIGDDSAGVDIPGSGTLYIQGGTGITTSTDSAGVVTINGQVGDITSITAGTGLDGGGTDGDITLNIDNTVATLSGTQILTNKTIDADATGNVISNIDIGNMTAAVVVLESEGIGSNDNDTTLPTSAAVKDYADTKAVLTGSTNNTIATVTGAHALNGEANLTFDGSVLGVTGTQTITNTTTDDSLTITTTEDSATAAPVITLKRNSGSPADADYLGQLKFKGENDADQAVNYAKITGKISDASDGTEDGLIEFALMKAGSNNIGARLNSTNLQLLNGTGLESNGNISTDGTLAVTGASTLDGVTITDNTVSSNASNADLEISANGTGNVQISSDGTFSGTATSTFTDSFGALSRNRGVHIFRSETIGSALTSSSDRRQGHLVGQQYTLGNFTSSDKDNRFRAQTVGCAVDLNGATLSSTNSFSGAMGAQGQAAVENRDGSNAGTMGNTIGMMAGSYFYSPQTVNITNAHGVFSYVEQDDGGGNITLTNAFAYKAELNKYHGTMTNGYGYYLASNDATNKFGFYDTTNSLSRFGAVQLDNQSGDPTHGADKSFIYAKDDSGSSEVFVKDEAGFVTKISPHNDKGEWEYYSVNKKTGKKLRVNMERMIRKLEEYTGESFIENE